MNDKRFYRASVCGDEVDKLNELSINCSLLQEENVNLIQKNCISCELVNLQTREIDKLKEENEQLKQKLENYYTVEMIDGKFFINLSELIDDE